ncbi:BRO family protein [Halomonas organivorans]|uniref:Prophage antirepressor-like protein n=1 Tax=Halomonas organivorans TaxID=257772 RepID=A0A7W5C167_9GAMM|nr:BRO family protein [Halomonas organivorans]MBB3142830.1 prophage antirepressor-like protein [Halomonas organivorans]
MQPMVFDGTEIELITLDGEVWARGTQIAHALGYRNASRAVRDVYDRNADEFTDTMTAVVDLPTAGGVQKVRIFSLRGAHLFAMFARTPKAKAFRRWVLDVLDTITQGGEYVRRKWEAAHQALEDRREQASAEGRGLASWRWEKSSMEMAERYWGERLQLSLALDH